MPMTACINPNQPQNCKPPEAGIPELLRGPGTARAGSAEGASCRPGSDPFETLAGKLFAGLLLEYGLVAEGWALLFRWSGQ